MDLSTIMHSLRIDRLDLLDDPRRDGADFGDELLQLLTGHRPELDPMA
jgi:hypothetical protein